MPVGMIGRAHIANLPQHKRSGYVGRAAGAVLRLILPVALLLTVGAACILYTDVAIPGAGTFGGKPVSLGLAMLPLTFFVIHLTNRRYGAAYAFSQVAIAWGLGLAALPSLLPLISPSADTRTVAGFGAALLLAQLVAIVLFDGLRGPTWWKAPLVASLAGGILLCVVAFPAAFAGTPSHWSAEMLDYMEISTAAAVVLLIPYGLLRSLVPPRPGFGGY
jgi:uncharacterized PurR-regulated membrane protein YhhQ (DUF165 family)